MVLFETGTVRIKYGADFQYLDLETVKLKSIIAASGVNTISDIAASVRSALDKPVDSSAPLSSRVKAGESVLLVVNDYTQRWFRPHLFLPHLVDYLNECGIPDEKIAILISNGSFRPRPDQHRCIVGDEVQERIRIYDHDSQKDEPLYLGTTTQGVPVYINSLVKSFDHLILTNGISYDLLAGFSGGRTSVCPGICGAETIKANHNLATLSSSGFEIGPGLLSANPLHQDMMEICAMAHPIFNFSVICNETGKHVAYFAGDWDTSWEIGCYALQQIYAVPVPDPVDVVIASVGGYPKDQTFYGSVKGLYQCTGAVKPGGTIIYLAECSEGHGNSTFFESMQLGSSQSIELSLASEFSVAKQVAFLHSQVVESYNVILVSSLSESECLQLGMKPAYSLADAISQLRSELKTKPEIAVLPQADLTLPIPLK
ncbi:MAG: nickel-dependent lactate racemase [Firmicutes bacterium]|nr:nickel-dependent lactate racemase [Bacillota bacterium]